MCRSHQEAIVHIANNSVGALRFRDLRHSYATWLVTSGVPVNVVRLVMGHEQTSSTLDVYTHPPDDYAQHVLKALERVLLYFCCIPRRTTKTGTTMVTLATCPDLRLCDGGHRWRGVDDPRPGGDGTGSWVASPDAVACGLTRGFLPPLAVGCGPLLDDLLSFCCFRSWLPRGEKAAPTAAGGPE
jgi:hypothetical protein